jgi:hypothetical protein
MLGGGGGGRGAKKEAFTIDFFAEVTTNKHIK